MTLLLSITLVLLPYLLGSIATAVWVSKGLYNVDIRTQGSNNAGSTNMFRMLGFKAGIITQIVDIGKGSLAAALPWFVACLWPQIPHFISHWSMEMQMLFCGLLAVIGHIYPVFAQFKGGKGINTLLGMMLVTNPAAAIICGVVWIFLLYFSRYVAIASMLAVFSYPLFVIVRALVTDIPIDWLLVGLGLGMFALVVFTHRSNIVRLMAGNEHKNTWFERKAKA